MWDIFSPHISSLRLGVSLFRVPCLPRSFQFSGCFKTEMRHRRRAPENVNVIPSRIWQRHPHIVIRLRRWEIVRDLCRATPQNVVARPFFARAGWCATVFGFRVASLPLFSKFPTCLDGLDDSHSMRHVRSFCPWRCFRKGVRRQQVPF